jgi:hypothetical protein
LLDECLRRAHESDDTQLRERLASLLSFTRQFDRGVGAVVASDSSVIAHLFDVLGRLDDATLERLLDALAAMPQNELANAAGSLAHAAIAAAPPAQTGEPARASSAAAIAAAPPIRCVEDAPGHLVRGRSPLRQRGASDSPTSLPLRYR